MHQGSRRLRRERRVSRPEPSSLPRVVPMKTHTRLCAFLAVALVACGGQATVAGSPDGDASGTSADGAAGGGGVTTFLGTWTCKSTTTGTDGPPSFPSLLQCDDRFRDVHCELRWHAKHGARHHGLGRLVLRGYRNLLGPQVARVRLHGDNCGRANMPHSACRANIHERHLFGRGRQCDDHVESDVAGNLQRALPRYGLAHRNLHEGT
jgi:hypothetical protein